jgi:hypothetical protein
MEPNKIAELFAELQQNIRSDLSVLSKRIETVERSISSPKEFSHSSFPPTSVLRSESGGHAASSSPTDPEHRAESSELHNLLNNFSPKDFSNSSPSFRRDSGRRTETSQFILKDPAIKLTPPKVTCKDPAKIRPKEFTIYFDEIEAFIEIWESQPGNRGKKFDGAENFALKNLKIAEQKQLAKLISVIYDRSELRFVKQSEIGNQIFWLSVTTAMAKAKLSAKMANETSLQACMRELQRIKFISHFGLIDPDAWDDYKKKILDLLAHQDSHGFEIPDTIIKDSIIMALPDLKYQQDLFLLFGPCGSMYATQDLNALIHTIEARIQSIMSQNLQAVVNQAVAQRDVQARKFKANVSEQEELFAGNSDDESAAIAELYVDCCEGEEIDDQMQLMAYLAAHNKEPCRRAGVGPDGKLRCKFLGGPKAQCIFVHSDEDMKLKGRGFTLSTPANASSKGDPKFVKNA